MLNIDVDSSHTFISLEKAEVKGATDNDNRNYYG